MSLVSILFEAGMAVLMVVLIVYCIRLNRALATVRSQDDQIRSMIAELNSAAERAEGSVARLKAAGLAAEESLRSAIADADRVRTGLGPSQDRSETAEAARRSLTRSTGAAHGTGVVTPFPADDEIGDPRESREAAEAAVLQAIRAARGGV